MSEELLASENAGLRSLLADVRASYDVSVWDTPCYPEMSSLDLYVSDELDGIDVAARYPALWRHLQECASCRSRHDDLMDLLAVWPADVTTAAAAPAVDLSSPAQDPWRALLGTAASGRPKLVFVFDGGYVRHSVTQHVGASFRSGSPATSDRLLLYYVGDTDAGEVIVQVRLAPARQPDDCLLVIRALAEPMPAMVAAIWSDQRVEARLSAEGYAELGPLPIGADCDDATGQALRLEIEL